MAVPPAPLVYALPPTPPMRMAASARQSGLENPMKLTELFTQPDPDFGKAMTALLEHFHHSDDSQAPYQRGSFTHQLDQSCMPAIGISPRDYLARLTTLVPGASHLTSPRYMGHMTAPLPAFTSQRLASRHRRAQPAQSGGAGTGPSTMQGAEAQGAGAGRRGWQHGFWLRRPAAGTGRHRPARANPLPRGRGLGWSDPLLAPLSGIAYGDRARRYRHP